MLIVGDMQKLLGTLAICLILTGCGDDDNVPSGGTKLDGKHYDWYISKDKKDICFRADNPYKFTYMKLYYFKAKLDGKLYKVYPIKQSKYRYPGENRIWETSCITGPSIEKYAKSNKKRTGKLYIKKGEFEFDFPSINLFGESKKDKKIKQLETKIKQLKRKSDNSKSIVDAINDLKMELILLDD